MSWTRADTSGLAWPRAYRAAGYTITKMNARARWALIIEGALGVAYFDTLSAAQDAAQVWERVA